MEHINDENKQENAAPGTPEPAKTAKGQEVMTRDEFERAKLAQNLPVGILAALVAAVVCAVLWAAISLGTGYQIGYMAIGVGAVVGYALRKLGKGVTQPFGIAGAIIALAGCLLGNILILIGSTSINDGANMASAAGMVFANLSTELIQSFHPMDVLFYGFAIGAGYRFAFKKVLVK